MARLTGQDDKLAETLQARGGLSQFRNVAERPREKRDNPFGPTPTSVASAPVEIVQPKPKVATPEPAPAVAEVQQPKVAKSRPRVAKSESKATVDPNTENVTVPLSRSLRDRSEELARVLNRNRSIRKSRITRNTIVRVALECMLDDLGSAAEHSVNSEEELLELARSLRRQ